MLYQKKHYRGFEAKHPGKCPHCDGPIDPGQRVKYDRDDDLVHFRHRECPACHRDSAAVAAGRCHACRS